MIIDVLEEKNGNFTRPYVVDDYASMIWSDRYNDQGDFELTLPVTTDNLTKIKEGRYLEIEDSENTMIIERVHVKNDLDGGSILATGRSLESLLDRRIVYSAFVANGNVQDEIQRLLNENIIKPSDTKRKMPNFVFAKSTDTKITSLTIPATVFDVGTNVYDIVYAIAKAFSIGFKITLDIDTFVFQLYCGEDRTYEQDENPYVVFSDEFDNLTNSSYLRTSEGYKNVNLAMSRIDDSTTYTSEVGNTSGLNRRELFTDVSSIEKEVDGVPLTETEYKALMEERAIDELSNYQLIEAFEGEADGTRTYVYGEDFKMGDLVQIADAFGNEGVVRVTELIISQNKEGYSMYPSFTSLTEEG